MLEKIKKLLGITPKETEKPKPALKAATKPVLKPAVEPPATDEPAAVKKVAKKRPAKKAVASKSTAKKPGRPKKDPEA